MMIVRAGMMLSAISRAGAVLSDQGYIARAVEAANFLHNNLTDPESGKLYRAAYCDKEGKITL